MPHTYSSNAIHIVFSTKDRRKIIPKDLQARLWAFISGIARNHEMAALAVGGTEDHAHILLRLPPTISLAKATLFLKANSSRWMSGQVAQFAWQEGYAAFSVSTSNLDQVNRYIQNQETHHRRKGFEDEFRELLKKHGVEYDPKFVFG